MRKLAAVSALPCKADPTPLPPMSRILGIREGLSSINSL